MGSKMLIDAAHREETRVVVFRGNRIEEFDYESADRKQLKGNIYLAKVTRVEPSLQAAFVDYGGNRHGFLAFSEIHPDYYQIPIADREALLREEEEEAAAVAQAQNKADDSVASDDVDDDDIEDSENVHTVEEDDNEDDDDDGDVTQADDEDSVAEDQEEAPKRRRKRQRRYRIQEVIKRRQVILVQVVKEERGNKGAALTTYLSLAGRYCVLMPNTARGGGISRKISDAKDRKRLKEVTQDMNVPGGAGLIVRTAGASRTKAEIKRDFEYLLRLWGNIRDLTLESTAPALVYEEGNLIKRSIRDLYNKDVDEVIVEGDQAYKDAKGFMKMLMPSHAKNVKHYNENRPLFSRFQVENQLDALYSPQVTLPSGGYLVMNQTEALVSIDINSGKATREHSIENTAVKTNLEASVEIARQLRLRDLAGLVVVDFIDMEERRNNRAVERKLKESLKSDRARIQVGRISHFGLLEMSRQRMRQSMLEGTTKPCPHCEGTGLIRSVSSCALSVLRSIEDHLIKSKVENLNVKCQRDIACFILNEKREHLDQIEKAYNISIFITPSDTVAPSECEIQRGAQKSVGMGAVSATAVVGETAYDTDDDKTDNVKTDNNQTESTGEDEEKPEGRKRRRRRRGRRGRKTPNGEENATEQGNQTEQVGQTGDSVEKVQSDDSVQAQEPVGDVVSEAGEASETKPAKRPRKRTRKPKVIEGAEAVAQTESPSTVDTGGETAEPVEVDQSVAQNAGDAEAKDKPKKRARKRPARKKVAEADVGGQEPVEVVENTTQDAGEQAVEQKAPARKTATKKAPAKKAAAKKTAARKPATKKPAAKKVAAKKVAEQEDSKVEPQPAPQQQDSKDSADTTTAEPARVGWKAPEATAADTGPARKGWWSR